MIIEMGGVFGERGRPRTGIMIIEVRAFRSGRWIDETRSWVERTGAHGNSRSYGARRIVWEEGRCAANCSRSWFGSLQDCQSFSQVTRGHGCNPPAIRLRPPRQSGAAAYALPTSFRRLACHSERSSRWAEVVVEVLAVAGVFGRATAGWNGVEESRRFRIDSRW